MLPFWILVFASMFFVYRAGMARQETLGAARQNAWYVASSGSECTRGAGGRGGCTIRRGSASSDGFLRDFVAVPIIGPIVGRTVEQIYGYSITAQCSESYDRPVQVGGGRGTAQSNYYLYCNGEKITVDSLLDDICRSIPILGFFC